MKIALIGNGAMGQLVLSKARKAGDEIACVVASKHARSSPEELCSELSGVDVVIDFSIADAVARNVEACVQSGVPIVEGTTGWKARENEVRQMVSEFNGALVYGANFSIGVNVFYRIAKQAAQLFSAVD